MAISAELETWVETCDNASRADAEEYVKLAALQPRLEGFVAIQDGRKLIHEGRVMVVRDNAFPAADYGSLMNEMPKV